MFCPKCGSEIPETSRFCGNCGHELGIRNASVSERYVQRDAGQNSANSANAYASQSGLNMGYGQSQGQSIPVGNTARNQTNPYGNGSPVASAIRPRSPKATAKSLTIMSVLKTLLAIALGVALSFPWLDAVGIRKVFNEINKNEQAEQIVKTSGIPTRSATNFEYPLYNMDELVQMVSSVEEIANDVKTVTSSKSKEDTRTRATTVSISNPESMSSYTQAFKMITMGIAGVWGIAILFLVIGILRTIISKKSGFMRFAFLFSLAVAIAWIVGIGYIDSYIVSNLSQYTNALKELGLTMPKSYFQVTTACYIAAAIGAVGFITTLVKRKA